MDKDDPGSKQLDLFRGGPDVKITDLTKSLMRHASKKYSKRSLDKIKMIVVHCTDRDWTMLQLNHYDVQGYLKLADGTTEINHISSSGLPAITYHDVIMPDGKPYHTLPFEEISWHASGYNSKSIAVAMMLRVTDEKTKKDTYGPSANHLKALQCHLGKRCLEFGLTPDKVVGHRELEGTGYKIDSKGRKRLQKTCPGMQTDLDLLRTNVATYMQLVLKMHQHYEGRIDGDFGPKSRAALAKFKKG